VLHPAEAAPARLRAGATHTEIRLFRIAMAVVAIAVVDDAFVHREPGTSAGDHLLGAAVPVAVALGLVLAYPHLRAGLRGFAALTSGALAVTAGVADGVAHVVVDGVAGDDVTSVLAAAAGVALLALGARTLWRSRRLDEALPRRYARRLLVGAAAVVAGWLVALPVALAIVITHTPRAPVERADLGRPYERVGFETADGLRLAGWYVRSRNGAAVIAFPGRSSPVRHARMLARHGYGVLLLDRRGEGESEGDFNGLGWNGEKDLAAALAFLRRRLDVERGRIGGLGLSVGGELLLQTAARHRALAAVVSEGAGIRSLREQMHTPGRARWLSPWLVTTAATAVLSGDSPPPDLAGLVPRIAPHPVFLIYAAHGQGGEELNPTYYAAARPPKALWKVPDGGHTGGLMAHPREYERRVIGFFDRALLR
jgi:hypothetical protein